MQEVQEIFNVSLYDVAWFFLIYAFLGWCLEVAFCSINTGKFVNRGFLNGPVCPIYGVGATTVTLVLTPLKDNFILLYIGSVLVTSLLELLTGFVLEKAFHTRWWDYSKRKFNIGGYICLRFSLAWGVACIFLMKVLHPSISIMVSKIPYRVGLAFIVIFLSLFICDFVVTLSAMMQLQHDLGEIAKIAQELHKSSDVLAEGLGNRAISVADKLDDIDLQAPSEKAKQKLAQGKDKWEITKEERAQKLRALQQHTPSIDKTFTNNMRIRKRLMKAFPDAKNTKFNEAWEQLKFRLQQSDKVRIAPHDEKTSDSEN